MKKIALNILLMIAAAVLIGWLSMVWLDSWTRHGQTVNVPMVKALSYDRAMTALSAEGLTGIVSDSVYDGHTSPGTVIEQNPKAGTVVKEGREVFMTIVAFSPKMVSLPTLTDISLRQARSILEGLDIKNVVERRVPSDFKDLVLGVRYKGARLQPGARVPVSAVIELEVGEGTPEIVVTDSVGDSESSSVEQLDLFQ